MPSRRFLAVSCTLAIAACAGHNGSAGDRAARSSPSPAGALHRTPVPYRVPAPRRTPAPHPSPARRVALRTTAPSERLAVRPATAAPPVATATPKPAFTPVRRATSDPAGVPMLPPDAPPRIVAVRLSSTTVRSGDRMSGSVITSSNVASVELRVANYGVGMEKVGVGRFSLSYQLGYVPFPFHGVYTMTVIARNARGDAATRTVPLTVR